MTDAQQSQSQTQASRKIPPGLVLGPDGKPCRVCTAFRHWNPMKAYKSNSSKSSNDDATLAAMAGAMGTLAQPNGPPPDCPPDKDQLGRSTWTFLHATAAYYPDQPTSTHRKRMLGILFALPVLFPCSWCAMHFGEEIQRSPPDVSNRENLSRWLCQQHNIVNERLGKPLFDCSIKSLDERWKDGPSDGRCD
ncbi:FAD-dependent thiol oxidase [Sanghuangporus baumii]|uniref:Sulfhydryl oxidase n=1 Tax=Sanghuangporus baumii TaxID=108892 RepID=A0A9Q5HTE5_SANBA|nr:FAD-dependent thiol oxidase [Sanghuangporus baumii]